MKNIQSKVSIFLPFALIVILLVFLFGKFLFPPAGKMLFGGDIYDAYFFWKNYLRQSIQSGNFPFWNPYNFSGTPFLAHPNINIFYPLNWLFIIFPLNISFTLYFFIHLIIAYLTMYWLGRRFTDKWGATFAAFSYSLSGYFAARIYSGHLEYVDTASWIPLAFGFTILALKKPSVKRIILSGVGLAILILSGNELFLLFTLELLGFYSLYLLVISEKNKNFINNLLTYLKVLMLSLLAAFGLSAVEFLPRFEFLNLSLRSLGIPYSLAVSGSATFSTLKLFISPFLFGLPQNYSGPWPNLSEYFYYIGIVPVMLIVFFIILRLLSTAGIKQFMPNFTAKVSKEVWFFILIIPIFAIISLGNNINPNIHELLWKFTPFYKSVRFPTRHLYLVVFFNEYSGRNNIRGDKK